MSSFSSECSPISFSIDANQLLECLKSLKISKNVDLKLNSKGFYFRVVDTKTYAALIDVVAPLSGSIPEGTATAYWNVDIQNLIRTIERYRGQDVNLVLKPLERVLEIYSRLSNKQYVLPITIDTKTREVSELELISSTEPYHAVMELETKTLMELLLNVQAIDTRTDFSMIRSEKNEFELILRSDNVQGVFLEKVNAEKKGVKNFEAHTVFSDIKITVASSAITALRTLCLSTVKVIFYQQYVVIEGKNAKDILLRAYFSVQS